MIFFRYTRNGGIVDLVKIHHSKNVCATYWVKSQIYPARLIDCLGDYPIPLPNPTGYHWADIRALKKIMLKDGWKLVKQSRDCSKYETGNRTTKRTVK